MRMHTLLRGGPYDGQIISLTWPGPEELRLPIEVMREGEVVDLAAAVYRPDLLVADDTHHERLGNAQARGLFVFDRRIKSDESLLYPVDVPVQEEVAA